MIAAAHHVTSPEEIRAQNHKRKTAVWWRDPTYRELSHQFLKDHPKCEYCGGKSAVVHHDNANSYRSTEEYYNPDNFTPACMRCHHEYRTGKIICPICKKHYIAKEGKHDRCLWCRGVKNPGQKKKNRTRLRHPCGNRVGQQRCQRDGRMFVCGFSAVKCRQCDHFKEKGGVA